MPDAERVGSREPRLIRLLRWAALAPVSYAAVVAARHLDFIYVAQLERYKSARLWRWILGHRRIVLDPEGAAVQVAVLAAGMAFATLERPAVWFYLAWVASGIWLAARRSSLQVSQRLQFTRRAVGLTALTLVAASGVTLGVATVAAAACARVFAISRTASVAIGLGVGLAVASEVAAGTVLLANLVLTPVEQAINRRFFEEAGARMRRYAGETIGITGSYGKTTTKFITAALLQRRYPVLRTPDGVNTTMGISRVVREDLRDDHRFFVVEVAAYALGEIREVCDLLRPRIGILTAVGVQHLERFGTSERIAEAKYELIASLPPDGVAIVNADDPGCMRLAERARREGRRVLLYGVGDDGRSLDVRGSRIRLSSKGSSFCIETPAGATDVETRLLGSKNIGNILGATAA
ncbi:MAG: Mur ligase family protein, partial [Candidatus Methylomirabilaceae bacterium]